ncbi:MAG: efflux RND transporter periplasmic adaptor subunit [Bacteroidetes bacterium]|nr:efflux RND transporter periplasmic adaptor subunit [Bacteroidota bacterium]
MKFPMKIYIIITSVIFLLACGRSEEKSQAENVNDSVPEMIKLTDAQLKSSDIKIGTIQQSNIASIIKVNGKIDVPPQNMVSVSMPLGGYLKSTKLLPGMHLNKGEVIATMEDQRYIELQQEFLTTQSELTFAEAEFNRQRELNQNKSTSDKLFQRSEMEFQTKKISLNALSEKLKLIGLNPETLGKNGISKTINIYSPIDGFVSKVNVNIGKFVSPTDILFELVNPTDIHLNLFVFEKDLEKISIGQKLVAFTNNKPNEKHPCEIILISKDLSADRTAEVHCHFEDYDKTLLPGMYMNAEIEVKSHKTYVVSEDAVVNFEGKNYVFIALSPSEFKMTEVELGVQERNMLEIINGESLKDAQVVLQNAYTLLMVAKNKSED